MERVQSRCPRNHLPHKIFREKPPKFQGHEDLIDRGIQTEFQISAERTWRMAGEG